MVASAPSKGQRRVGGMVSCKAACAENGKRCARGVATGHAVRNQGETSTRSDNERVFDQDQRKKWQKHDALMNACNGHAARVIRCLLRRVIDSV
jgi:hypothetical protein